MGTSKFVLNLFNIMLSQLFLSQKILHSNLYMQYYQQLILLHLTLSDVTSEMAWKIKYFPNLSINHKAEDRHVANCKNKRINESLILFPVFQCYINFCANITLTPLSLLSAHHEILFANILTMLLYPNNN